MKEGGTSLHKTIREINLVNKGLMVGLLRTSILKVYVNKVQPFGW